jgi:hypothetical protein
MVRTQIIVSVAFAVLLAGACQEQEGSEEQSALDADIREGSALVQSKVCRE